MMYTNEVDGFSFLMNHNFIAVLSSFDFLFEFEPNVEKIQVQRAKRKFNSLNFEQHSIEDILEKFKDFPVFSLALAIVYEALESINELSNSLHSSTKEMQRFKSNDKYLNRYINSFQDTVQLFRNLGREEDANEIEEIVNIFKHIKDDQTRHNTLQWLITEYLTYILDGDISYQELFPQLSKSLTKERDEAIQKQLLRRVNIYQHYFDGFDISKEDIYRSMLIKLYHLYAQYGSEIGRGDANPNKHIETIARTLRNKDIKISPKKMKNIYIKGFFSGIAIFDYKTDDDQRDAIDEYFKLQFQSPLTTLASNSKELIINQRQKLLNELILL